jgi:DNA-directed RNA polymerase specialized sigma24 family protein
VTPKQKKLAAEAPAPIPLSAAPTHFDECYRKFFLPLVRRAAWKHSLTKEDARDVVQEAFIVALAKMDPHRNPKAWLIQVVDHLSLNFQRKLVRRARLALRWTHPDSHLASIEHLGETAQSYDEVEESDGGDD